MGSEKRGTWGTRSAFILAAIGSAVGLGNAWRFPGLAAKHGGGAFIFVYVLAMVIIGIPLLMMEISIGRKMRKGSAESMRGINKKLEPVGWAATANAFVISIYYAIVFAWVILMAVYSFKFADITKIANPTDRNAVASSMWANLIGTTWGFNGFSSIKSPILLCLMIAWIAIYVCIRNGTTSVGKVVKYTVFLPVICLIIMAIKGFTMNGAMAGLSKLFVPDFSHLSDPTLWVDAVGQVFYSLSIMMAIMFAYGSYLKKDSNIAVDGMIIAFSDFFTSILSSIVLFTTMYGVGMSIDDMSASGIGTAFIIYPTAIVNLSESGIINAIFAFIFYFCLCTLAIDSAFSIIEGVSASLADKFKFKAKKTTLTLCVIAGLASLIMTTGAGVAILDTVDNWCNSYNLVLIGVLETIGVGWCFRTKETLSLKGIKKHWKSTSLINDEVNRNTKKFKMPSWWFNTVIMFIAPLVLASFFVWNLIALFSGGGVYGGYPVWSNVVFGWLVTLLVFASGFIIKAVVKAKQKKGDFIESDVSWDTVKDSNTREIETPVVSEVTAEETEELSE